MSQYPKFENFNNFTMNLTSFSFYLTTINVVTLILIFDNAFRKLLYLFSYYEDPTKIIINKLDGMKQLEDSLLVNKGYDKNTCSDLLI